MSDGKGPVVCQGIKDIIFVRWKGTCSVSGEKGSDICQMEKDLQCVRGEGIWYLSDGKRFAMCQGIKDLIFVREKGNLITILSTKPTIPPNCKQPCNKITEYNFSMETYLCMNMASMLVTILFVLIDVFQTPNWNNIIIWFISCMIL